MTKNIQHDATFNFQKISTPNFDPQYEWPLPTQQKNWNFVPTGLESVAN